jgi:hypothetical protein
MMLLPKDIAADAVESSSAAALAIAAADRIPCGRDAVAAADAAESSDEYSATSTAIFCRSNASLRILMSPSTPPLFPPPLPQRHL